MDRYAQIAEGIAREAGITQGWYEARSPGRIILWSLDTLRTGEELVQDIVRVAAKLAKTTEKTASIVGKKSQWTQTFTGVYGGKFGVVCRCQLLATPEDMEGLQEGQP